MISRTVPAEAAPRLSLPGAGPIPVVAGFVNAAGVGRAALSSNAGRAWGGAAVGRLASAGRGGLGAQFPAPLGGCRGRHYVWTYSGVSHEGVLDTGTPNHNEPAPWNTQPPTLFRGAGNCATSHIGPAPAHPPHRGPRGGAP
ncbi:hypothetical protein F3K43_11060 [Streptomyces sp. LBUM 1476]|nr:hypothetical protein [Streptomyces sp. LBUM 1476]